jgi:hypothetical protein
MARPAVQSVLRFPTRAARNARRTHPSRDGNGAVWARRETTLGYGVVTLYRANAAALRMKEPISPQSVPVDVTATHTLDSDSGIDRVFGPLVQSRTYRNLAYALISFPFGLASFVMIITGLSVGVGTAIIFIGFLILALTLALGRLFGGIERWLMESLLGAHFEVRVPPVRRGRLPAGLTDQRAWLSAMYFVVRFPLAIAGFVASVLFLASTVAMAAPFLYTFLPIMFLSERVSNSEEALLVSLIGCVLFLVAAHMVNGLAAISRRLAVALL